jgi:Ca2+-transporting ATPase
MKVAVAHHLPGRVRFRVDPDAVISIQNFAWKNCVGISSFAMNPLTGSLLITFLSELTSPVQIKQQIDALLSERELDASASARRTVGQIVSEQARSLPSVLLVAAGGLSLLSGAVLDAAVIGTIWLVNSLLGAGVEVRAEQAIKPALEVGLYRVTRQRQTLWLQADSLQPGDRIALRPGLLIPADGTITRDKSLCLDESLLTGESSGRDQPEVAWAGTRVLAGTGVLTVTHRRHSSRLNRLGALVQGHSLLPDSLQRELAELTKALCLLSGVMAFGLVGVGLSAGLATSEVLATAISLAISTIPEGLSSVALLALVRSARRLSTRGVVVRRLSALPGLGLARSICLDKTGTLTNKEFRLDWLDLHGERILIGDTVARHALHSAQLACESVSIPFDRAILAANPILSEKSAVRRRVRTSKRPYVSAECAGRLAFKGAPEAIIASCRHEALQDGTIRRLAEVDRTRLLDRVSELGGSGYVILGVAGSHGALEAPSDWTFQGLLVFSNSPRPEAADTVNGLLNSGLGVEVLTGDLQASAESLLRQIDSQGRCKVQARLTPEGKHHRVQQLQQGGAQVIMVGDGFNDCPALRAADVAVALDSGVVTSLALADIVVLSSDIGGVAAAVLEGRAALASITRGARYLLSACFADIVLVAVCLLLRIPFPMSGRQLLWMNLVSDLLPGLALVEDGAGNCAQESTAPSEQLTSPGLARAVARDSTAIASTTLLAYVWALRRYGAGPQASTVAFSAVTLSEIAYALACRPGRGLTPHLRVALSLAVTAQLATVLVPGLSLLMGTVSLGMLDWLVVGAATTGTLGSTLLFQHRQASPFGRKSKQRPVSRS